MNCIKQMVNAFALFLMFALFAFAGCEGKSSGNGGEPEAAPPATGGIEIRWPFSNVPLVNAMVGTPSNVNELAVSVFQSDGVKVPGAQGRVSATNLSTTLTVPVGTGYSVCALAMPVPGPLAIPVGSGCAVGVSVLATPEPATPVSIFLADNASDVTLSAPSTAAAPNYAYGETPTVTVVVNSVQDTAFVATPASFPYGSELNPGLPANITDNGANVFIVNDGFPATSTINQLVCSVPFPSGTSCVVSAPGLGANFSVAYSAPVAFRVHAQYPVDDYAMPSTSVNQVGMPTLWPVASTQPATTWIDVLSLALVAPMVNPSPTGGLDINFR